MKDEPWRTFTARERKYMETVAGVPFPEAWRRWTTYVTEKNGKTVRELRYPKASPARTIAIVHQLVERGCSR